ncbi:GHMP family kinase ATP-binding protein [Streptomyces xiamenensis]
MIPSAGTGKAPCHHGEILQGAFRDRTGRTSLGLVTLSLPATDALGSRAEFTPCPEDPAGRLTVHPPDRVKALRAAASAIAECARRTGRRPCGGRLLLRGAVPVGLGMGSSTSDIIATIRAVAAGYRVALTAPEVARLAVAAEHACDPLMLDDGRAPVLFAQREGRVLEVLGTALPPAVVVGCATGGGAPVDTLALPTDAYRDEDVTTYERLRGLLRRAVTTADTALLGRVCTASARLHQRLLTKEELPLLEAIAAETGAAGVQIAHSGNVAGVLFDPALPRLRPRIRRCLHRLERTGLTPTRIFTTSASKPDPENEKVSTHARARRRRDRRPRPDTARTRTDLPAL